ncbi:Peptidase M18 like protein, partial [Aduncisulcus paluster]
DRKARDVMKGEEMHVLVGGLPYAPADTEKEEEAKEKIKTNVLDILFKKYGIKEADFKTAELSFVSGISPRYVGFDKAFIAAAGQDDGVCSYCGVEAMFQMCRDGVIPERTCVMVGHDKEEIGSNGPTGAQSRFFTFVLHDLVARITGKESAMASNAAFTKSFLLSADVTAAVNPIFTSPHDPKLAAKAGYGVCVEKYTGHGGKYGTNDATAEAMGELKAIFKKHKVPYVVCTLGKVGAGGGGTICKFTCEQLACDGIDVGTPVLAMHSPYELCHVCDIYATFKAYLAFYKGMREETEELEE